MSSPISSNLGPTARNPEHDGERETSPTMARLRYPAPILRSCWLLIVAAAPHARADDLNDYPTSARADYVFGCMKANGETQELLQKCSCSIDVIASIIPYDRYVAAETIISMSQVTGPGRF